MQYKPRELEGPLILSIHQLLDQQTLWIDVYALYSLSAGIPWVSVLVAQRHDDGKSWRLSSGRVKGKGSTSYDSLCVCAALWDEIINQVLFLSVGQRKMVNGI